MCEILAPAGGKESAMAAINSGADAIYLGLTQFSARSSAENFDTENFLQLSRYARAFGVKIYVAMNTLVKDEELVQFLSTLVEVWNAGADAIILSDIFLGKYIKACYPEITLHLSTQAGVCNVYGAKLAKKYGFDRVILSRETPIEEIKLITKVIETEVFVQGALCTCFSGQCYMSSFAGGNSGNRGKCKQPCRKLYSLDRKGFEAQAYRLSLSDLCVGNGVFELIEAGVSSFKIEGRMRRPEYVAAAVNYYKNLLNGSVTSSDLSNLKRTYNRGNYTKGLIFGQDKSFISSAVQGHIGEFIGFLKVRKGKYYCCSDKKFVKGDGFKILRGGKEVGGAEFVENTSDGFIIGSKARLCNGDKVFITTDSTVNASLLSNSRKINVKLSARFLKGERAAIEIGGLEIFGNEILEEATSRPLTADDIKECFNKVDKYPFHIEYTSILTDGVFIPSSAINALRRTVYERYFDYISENKNKKIALKHSIPNVKICENNKIAVISTQNIKTDADITIFKPKNYALSDFVAKDLFLYLPPFMTTAELERCKRQICNFGGIYCDGSWAIELANELQMPLFAGAGFNISNCIDVTVCPADYTVLSKELTFTEQRKLSGPNVFALSLGDIKVMDLIYCPFEKRCAECDKRNRYTLTDENGRKFPIRRYQTSACRFEVYNCASLVGVSPVGVLIDCSLGGSTENLIKICRTEQKQRDYFKNYTRGHGNSPVL